MKKIALFILFSLIINYTLGIASAFATNSENSSNNIISSRLIAETTPDDTENRAYSPPIIYKPKTLPGPTSEYQKDVFKSKDTKKINSTRGILSDILLPKATTGFIGFVSMAAFLMLVISGVRFVVAYGNQEDITKARNQTIYSMVGLVLALLAYTIVSIIANLNLDLPTTTP